MNLSILNMNNLCHLATIMLVMACAKWGIAQDCPAPQGSAHLDINNVNAQVNVGQLQWSDPNASEAWYEVPAGQGVSSMYAGNLWIGGVSPDNQLHLAAGRFGVDGTDFFAGPLSLKGVQALSCEEFDQVWKLYRIQSLLHVAHFDCINDPECTPDPNYQTPEVFYSYPVFGNPDNGEVYQLAPFYDYDLDGVYNPDNGDCPLFEGMAGVQDCQECEVLKGDLCLFWIDNDAGGIHTASQGNIIGVEIHNKAYAYATSDVLNNQTFYCKKIINRGTLTLSDTYIGIWNDADVGTATDDYVQCDINRNLGFTFNGDSNDESSSSSQGYGTDIPVCGIKLLHGPWMDPDGLDNDNDGIADNEALEMTNFLYYNNASGIGGEPSIANHYYSYMQSDYQNGVHFSCDMVTESEYMFAGDTYPEDDPCFGMTEITEGNPPGDRRFVMSSGPFTFEPGTAECLNYAVVWARNPEAQGSEASIQYFLESADSVQNYVDDCFSCIPSSAAYITTQTGDNTYQFMPASSFGNSYSWSFGDGTTSDEVMPTHTFPSSGDYTVCLTVTNGCSEVYECTLQGIMASVEDVEDPVYTALFNTANATFSLAGPANGNLRMRIFDSTGKLVQNERIASPSVTNLNHLPNGMYVIVVENGRGVHLIHEKAVIQHP